MNGVDPKINPRATKSLTRHQIHAANTINLIQEGDVVKNVVKNLIRIGGGFAENVVKQFKNSLEEIKKLCTLKPT